MPVHEFNIDGDGAALGDVYSETHVSNTRITFPTSDTLFYGSDFPKDDTSFKNRAWFRFFLNVASGAQVRRITMTLKAAITFPDLNEIRFGLLTLGNAVPNSIYQPSPWPAGHTGNWALRGSGLEHAHSKCAPLEIIVTDSFGPGGLILSGAGPNDSWGGFWRHRAASGVAIGSQSAGNSYINDSGLTFDLDEVRRDLSRSGSRPGVFLAMEIWSVGVAPGYRTDVLLKTSDFVAWDSLPTEPLSHPDTDDWIKFKFDSVTPLRPVVGDRFATKLVVSGGGLLPSSGSGGNIRDLVDLGRDTDGNPSYAAGTAYNGLFWGRGGWAQSAHPRGEDMPVPSPDTTEDVLSGICFQDRLIPDSVSGPWLPTSYVAEQPVVFGEDLDCPGEGITFTLSGMCQLFTDWFADPGYVASGMPTCVVIDTPLGVDGYVQVYAENDPDEPGMVLAFRVASGVCDWADDPLAVEFSDAEAGGAFSAIETGGKFSTPESGSAFSVDESATDWATDKDCD